MNKTTPLTKKAIKAMFPKNLNHDELANHLSVITSALVNMMIELMGAENASNSLKDMANAIDLVTGKIGVKGNA